jgi:predicted nucleic acid-binding protein
LIDAKTAGYLTEVAPSLDELERLRFRMSAELRREVLRLAREA